MPTRRQITRLALNEASTIDNKDYWLLGSDDELDEAARERKTRRIEALGESYLQGNTLFIASSSLRGPFDTGWVNPWKKHRRQNDCGTHGVISRTGDGVTDFVVPDTNESRKNKESILPRGKSVHSDVRGYSSSPRTTPHLGSGQSKLTQKDESSISHIGRGLSADRQPAQAWLKRDYKVADILNYDPPKSPSSRYANPEVNGSIKLPQSTSRRLESGLARPIKTHQTDLRNVRRKKRISGESQGKDVQMVTDAVFPEKEGYQKSTPGARPKEIPLFSKTAEQQNLSDKLDANEFNASPKPGAHQDTHIPASASSVHIVPPSSHLPEFEYRILKARSAEGTENKLEHPVPVTEYGLPPIDKNPQKESSLFKAPSLRSHEDQASVPATSTATLTYSEKQNDSLTESERIPSAQVVSKPPGTSTYFISLHSAEYRAPDAADNGTNIDGELSTQAAFELAQKSFQDDLATPQRGSQSPPKMRKSVRSATQRITPFANVNNNIPTSGTKLDLRNTPVTNHNMNTQAMIEAFTPFSDTILGGGGNQTERRSEVHIDIVKTRTPKNCDFEALSHSQPRSKLPQSPPIQAGQKFEHESLPLLPLTLSGTTPATNQQDGQGYFFSQDAFDVSQVIKDAGSWLQRSFDITEDLKEITEQSSPPISRAEVKL